MNRWINVDRLSWSKPMRGSSAAINGRPWTAAIGMPAIKRTVYWDEYQTQIQPLRGSVGGANGFVPTIIQTGGGRQTRYVGIDQTWHSRAQRGSSAAINGSGLFTDSADVMSGMDIGGWPPLETSWWSPPMPFFQVSTNRYIVYNPAIDMVRAKQSKWVDEYQQQLQPQRAFPAAEQAFTVYNFAADTVRARQAAWIDEYQRQLQALQTFAAGINGQAGPVVTPTYTFGPRYIILARPRPFTISAITMQQFDVKDPSESVMLTFNFAPDLPTGTQLFGTPSVNVSVIQGSDPSPASILNGRAGFDSTQTQVVVPVFGGVSGTFYEVQVSCATNNSNLVLSLAGIMPVSRIM